ncbi:MAG: type II secretion system protein GspN [Deltaproteobacteria bacterium]|nr:type II secretion system protein GspN [Deltaproteobacteria bacterium]
MRFLPAFKKFLAYGSWFSLVFVLSFYATFPINKVRGKVVAGLEDAMGKGKQGRHGTDPSVQIGKMSLGGGAGIQLENVQMQFGSRTKDPGFLLHVDDVTLSTSLLSLLTNSPKANIDAKLYGGTATGSVELGNKKFAEEMFGVVEGLASGRMKVDESIQNVALNVENLRLDRLPPLKTLKGLGVGGTLSLDVDLDLGENASKEGTGSIVLGIEGASVGPGEYLVSIPLVRLGKVTLDLPFVDGKGESKTVSVDGKDVKADLDLKLTLSKRLLSSRLAGGGWVQPDEAFLNGDGSKLKMAYDLLPQLKRAKDDEEKVHFKLRGTLKSPGGSLDASKGKSRSKNRSGRSKSKRSKRSRKAKNADKDSDKETE